MFRITGNAHKILQDSINKEKKTENEILYIRLSMGIG
ncbi:hypothetical protein QFZ87_002885 [Bacillus sp. SLBN-46]|nr:hypothetical protein [Bacillus sp. SLBN-46]